MAEFGSNEKIVLTDEQIVQVEALASTLSLEQVAGYFGMSKVTFYAIMERQPEVGLRYKKGKANAINMVAKGLIMQALEGNTAASCFYLKTQAGWKETNVTEHAGGLEIKEIRNVIVDPIMKPSILDK